MTKVVQVIVRDRTVTVSKKGVKGDPGSVAGAIAFSTGPLDANKITKTNDQGDIDRSFMPPGVPDENNLPDFTLLFENGLV